MSKLCSQQRLALVSFVAGVIVIAGQARAESFVIDPKNTEVRFTYTMAYSVQRGRFTRVDGTMDFDDKAPEKTRVNAVIQTASLTTGEAMSESELKGSSFFNTAKQPEIRFESQTVEMTGPDAAQMTGAITVNGITQPITFDVSIKSGDDPKLKYRVGSRRFTATATIQRSAFYMTAYSSMVDDEVGIEIDALVKRTKPTASAN
jgi:polyisoprenoid-binding protein YceI